MKLCDNSVCQRQLIFPRDNHQADNFRQVLPAYSFCFTLPAVPNFYSDFFTGRQIKRYPFRNHIFKIRLCFTRLFVNKVIEINQKFTIAAFTA